MATTRDEPPGIPAPSPLRYIPALDGLRGLSLPGTIFTHFAIFFILYLDDVPSWLRYAWPFTLNIEMFFVLSGALITSMLVSERQRKGRVSLKTFYLRRSRRLGPALIAVIPLLLIAHFTLESGTRLEPLGTTPWITAAALLLFVGNWRLSGDETGLGWLGPAWTLGIEEQFYLTWPALLLLMLRRWKPWRIVFAVGLVSAACVLFSSVAARELGTSRTNYMTPTHLPPLLLGCLLGYWLATFPGGTVARLLRSSLVALLGLAGMTWISIEYAFNRVFLDSGGYAIYGVFSCLLIGHCFVRAAQPGVISRFLSWKPLVVIGQVSYEAYLVHVIVILAVLRIFPTMDVVPMMVLDTVLIAVISGAFYYFIGRPIRRQGWGVIVGRPTANRPTPPLAEIDVPVGDPQRGPETVFGVLAVALVAAATSVLAVGSWAGASLALILGVAAAHVAVRQPAQR